MIEARPESTDQLLAFDVRGKIRHQDYSEVLEPAVTAQVERIGRARLLLVVHELDGAELRALWDDAQFGLRHIADLDRVAIVGALGLLGWVAELAEKIAPAHLKAFHLDELEAARRWALTGHESHTATAG